MMWMERHDRESCAIDSDNPFDLIERKKKIKEDKGKKKAAQTFLKLKLKRKKK